MELPYYIKKAVEFGLMEVVDGKVINVNTEAIDTVVGAARIVNKLQPTSIVQDGTSDGLQPSPS